MGFETVFFCSVVIEIVQTGLSKYEIVADIFADGNRTWSSDLLENIPMLQGVDPQLPEQNDKVVWVSKSGKQTVFILRQAWKDLRSCMRRVLWWDMCFLKSIPKHCLCFGFLFMVSC